MPVEQMVFVDSNIWLYAFMPNQDGQRAMVASQFIRENRPKIILSTQVVNEVTNNLLRKGRFVEEDIRSTIHTLYNNFQVVQLNEATHIKASELREQYALSHFDGIIVASALLANAKTLCSEDMQAELVVENRLTIVNPFAP